MSEGDRYFIECIIDARAPWVVTKIRARDQAVCVVDRFASLEAAKKAIDDHLAFQQIEYIPGSK